MSTAQVVGRVGDYRVVQLSKVIDPSTEKRRCVLNRHLTDVQGVVDYHTDLDIVTHLGTHVEAPYHHAALQKDVTAIAFDQYIARGVLLNLDSAGAGALITTADLEAADGGRVRAGDVVILDSPYHCEPFAQSPVDDRPQLSKESAEWFLSKKVKAVGFGDGVAIENDATHCVACHDLLLGNDILFIEVLQNINLLQTKEFLIVFLPLPIRGLDSSPVHAVAIEGVPGL